MERSSTGDGSVLRITKDHLSLQFVYAVIKASSVVYLSHSMLSVAQGSELSHDDMTHKIHSKDPGVNLSPKASPAIQWARLAILITRNARLSATRTVSCRSISLHASCGSPTSCPPTTSIKNEWPRIVCRRHGPVRNQNLRSIWG